jgi:hypothetical protein
VKQLIGRNIREIYVDKQYQMYMRFETDSGRMVFNLYSDRCSESWFSDIYQLDVLLGHRVTAVEEIEMKDVMPDYNVEDGRCRQECDSVYGIRITTDAGTAMIAFRNSSNGYYGGHLNEKLSNPAPDTEWDRITGNDWQANYKQED